MMPKVLPHMIRLVEQTIEMPDYLRNQLPDLFPEVVDNVHAQDAAADHAEVRAGAVRQAAQLNGLPRGARRVQYESPASAAASVSWARSTSRTMSQAWVICG